MYPMRSRTASESTRTSSPSTRAEPLLSGRRPVSILMTVVLPLPLGPRKPKISPFSTRKLTSFTAVNLPNRRTRCSAEIAGSSGLFVALAIRLLSRLQFDVSRHSCKHPPGGIVDPNLHAKHLMDALLAGLHVARQEFGLLVDLLNHAVEHLVREGIH